MWSDLQHQIALECDRRQGPRGERLEGVSQITGVSNMNTRDSVEVVTQECRILIGQTSRVVERKQIDFAKRDIKEGCSESRKGEGHTIEMPHPWRTLLRTLSPVVCLDACSLRLSRFYEDRLPSRFQAGSLSGS